MCSLDLFDIICYYFGGMPVASHTKSAPVGRSCNFGSMQYLAAGQTAVIFYLSIVCHVLLFMKFADHF